MRDLVSRLLFVLGATLAQPVLGQSADGVHPNPSYPGQQPYLRYSVPNAGACYHYLSNLTQHRDGNRVLIEYSIENIPPEDIGFCGVSPGIWLTVRLGSLPVGDYVAEVTGHYGWWTAPVRSFPFQVLPYAQPANPIPSLGLLELLALIALVFGLAAYRSANGR